MCFAAYFHRYRAYTKLIVIIYSKIGVFCSLFPYPNSHSSSLSFSISWKFLYLFISSDVKEEKKRDQLALFQWIKKRVEKLINKISLGTPFGLFLVKAQNKE
jgi:hypothetical protein